MDPNIMYPGDLNAAFGLPDANDYMHLYAGPMADAGPAYSTGPLNNIIDYNQALQYQQTAQAHSHLQGFTQHAFTAPVYTYTPERPTSAKNQRLPPRMRPSMENLLPTPQLLQSFQQNIDSIPYATPPMQAMPHQMYPAAATSAYSSQHDAVPMMQHNVPTPAWLDNQPVRTQQPSLPRKASSSSLNTPYARKKPAKRPSRLNLNSVNSPQQQSPAAYSQRRTQSYQQAYASQPMPSPSTVNIAGLSLSPEDLIFLDQLSPTSASSSSQSTNISPSNSLAPNASIDSGYMPSVPMSAPAWQSSFNLDPALPASSPMYSNFSVYSLDGGDQYSPPSFGDARCSYMQPSSLLNRMLPPRPRSAPLESAETMQALQAQYLPASSSAQIASSPTKAVRTKPGMKRRVTTAASSDNLRKQSSAAQFVNFTSADANKLLTGVAPSGSSKRKRDEEEQRRKRSSASPESEAVDATTGVSAASITASATEES